MESGYSEADERFRAEVREFLRTAVPEESRRKIVEGRKLSKEDIVGWQRLLNAKGWAVPHWPQEWGGTGWSAMRRYILMEEIQRYPAPQPLSLNVNMIGPVIAAFGTDQQKRRFLPRIANLDDWWAQGFSEPDAGSDLAALKMSARWEGGEYVLNGQKTWATYAQYADWIFCLVRTSQHEKKQHGISFLLVDIRSPGITVRPIKLIDGSVEVNDVFFDDVRVPAENRIGEEGRGWEYAKFLLGSERTNIARIGVTKERMDRAREISSTEIRGGTPLQDDILFRRKMAVLEVRLKALEITQLRALAAKDRGSAGKTDMSASVLKVAGSELMQSATALLMDVAGLASLPREASAGQDASPFGLSSWEFSAAAGYFNARKTTIYGGSSEIQKNIIANSLLGA